MFATQSKSTTATSTVTTTPAGVGDDTDPNTWSQSPALPTPSASTVDVSSHSTAADPLLSTETMTSPLDVHGNSRYKYNSGGSDDSNELTFTQEPLYEPQMRRQLSLEQLNQLDIDEEPVTRASDAKIEEEQHVESTNELSSPSEQNVLTQVNPPTADNVLTQVNPPTADNVLTQVNPPTADNVLTDEENPFMPYPKPPVLSAAESDGETMLGATAALPLQQLVRQY